jgi:predicted enzyme related to lactoylglutathione lyase
MKPCRNTDILCRESSLATSPMQGDHRSMAKQFRLSDQSIIGFVATSDPDRAKKFYRDTLALPLVSEEMPFALVFDAHGTMLRVTIVKKVIPAGYTVLGWQVPNIVAAAEALSKAGVRFERYQGMQQDELGIWSSPGGGRVAWFKDTDGNTLSISQH